MKNNLYIAGGLFAVAFVAGMALSVNSVLAEDVIDSINLTVPVSCSLSGTSLSSTAEIRNGIYTDNIGSANIKATCTDTAGFDIYAIGYTGDTYGNNKMHDSNLSTDYDIPTGKYTQGTTTESAWSMKLIPATGTYTPTIRNDSTYDYTDYEVVPSEYVKVAYRESGTDYGEGSIGANFSTKYAVYADIEQPAGEYTGQVKFTLVHPNDAPAPEPPTPPGPAPSSTCTTPVPNITYMQDINSSNVSTVMNSMADNAQYYLRDSRDEEPYCVSKIKTKNNNNEDQYAIWMTQNLRITGIVSSEGSNFSTYSSVNVCEGDLTAGNSYDEPRCHDSGNTTNGVWYNYAAASAKTILGSSNTTLDTENICPANWTLPSYDTNKPAGSVNSLVGSDSVIITAFTPVAGGRYGSGSLYNTSDGYWWSTTASYNSYRYYLNWNGSSLSTGNVDCNRGVYIRCMRAL